MTEEDEVSNAIKRAMSLEPQMKRSRPNDAHMEVYGSFDRGSKQEATLTMDRGIGHIKVRIKNGREYSMPAEMVAAIIVAKVTKAELPTKKG